MGLVQGTYRHRSPISQEDVNRMYAKYAYPGRKTQLILEMVTTVVYDYELVHPSTHWEECLTIIQKIMKKKNP
ncbi:MAG: hypothetical protein ACFFAE_08960 [Candidatus Hodarchaeota archaeon]